MKFSVLSLEKAYPKEFSVFEKRSISFMVNIDVLLGKIPSIAWLKP
jgi:hypothetical protein